MLVYDLLQGDPGMDEKKKEDKREELPYSQESNCLYILQFTLSGDYCDSILVPRSNKYCKKFI